MFIIIQVPPTREVVSSMPNVFSALCLNSRGLNAFIKYNPFRKLFRILISPEYLPAMRRRRTAEPMGDTASNLGNAMDELMRHQPSLKIEATTAIVDVSYFFYEYVDCYVWIEMMIFLVLLFSY